MNWSNLKINKCPKCNKLLMFGITNLITCPCGFSIGQKRMKEIITSKPRIYEKPYRPEDENEEVIY